MADNFPTTLPTIPEIDTKIGRKAYIINLCILALIVVWAFTTEFSQHFKWVPGLLGMIGIVTLFGVSRWRLNDIGRSPWFAYFVLIPGINIPVIAYLMAAPSKPDQTL